jgi:hypothetical protein
VLTLRHGAVGATVVEDAAVAAGVQQSQEQDGDGYDRQRNGEQQRGTAGPARSCDRPRDVDVPVLPHLLGRSIPGVIVASKT